MALRLVALHRSALQAYLKRSPADFRTLACVVGGEVGLGDLFYSIQELLPPSMLRELEPHLLPRLRALATSLRSRLARTRRDLPLDRVRELDAACLRTLARRPGRSIIEKSGPKQRMRGVVRVARYDTQENRVLRAACAKLDRLVIEALSGLSPESVRGHSPAWVLHRLRRYARALVGSPELSGLGLPRPGERPSNALLHDANYRAVWRAYRKLGEEEERFLAEWRSLDELLLDLVLLTAWEVMDSCPGLEAVPSWVQVFEEREQARRLLTGGARTWIGLAETESVEWTVDRSEAALRVRRRTFGGAAVDEREWTFHVQLRPSGADTGAEGLDALVAESGVPFTFAPDRSGLEALRRELRVRLALPDRAEPVPVPALESHRGVSALGPVTIAQDASGSIRTEVTAASLLPSGDDAAPALRVFGRPATWTSRVSGPWELLRDDAELGGEFLARHGRGDSLAVIVPDDLDEEATERLRGPLGASWFVWQSIGAALAAAAMHPEAVDGCGTGGVAEIMVIGGTSGGATAVTLTRRGQGASRVFLRRPGCHALPPVGAVRPSDFSVPASSARAAWLRSPGSRNPWARLEGVLHRTELEPNAAAFLSAISRLAEGGRPDLVIVAASPLLHQQVRQALPGLPLLLLDEAAYARGALEFQQRRLADLPTWLDQLPHVAITVRQGGRSREQVDLIPQGVEVAPGDQRPLVSKDVLTLEAGKARIDLHLERDGKAASYQVRLEGPPFPLARPVRVRPVVIVKFAQGALEMAMRPEGAAPFRSLSFKFTRSTSPGSIEPVIPLFRDPPPLDESQASAIEAAEANLAGWWHRLRNELKDTARRQEGALDKVLLPLVQDLNERLEAVRGTSSGSLRPELRPILERAAARLDWLLDLGRGPDKARDQKPPKLSRRLRQGIAKGRSLAGLRGTGKFGAWLTTILPERDSPPEYRCYLGRVAEDDPSTTFSPLICTALRNDEDRRELGRGLFAALSRHPDFALRLDGTQAELALRTVIGAVESIPPVAPRRNHLAALFSTLPHLCRVRHNGHLLPGTPAVVDAVQKLEAYRARMPQDLRGFAENSTDRDEPISHAIDALCGRDITLPILEDQP